jgi:hypothetical protein
VYLVVLLPVRLFGFAMHGQSSLACKITGVTGPSAVCFGHVTLLYLREALWDISDTLYGLCLADSIPGRQLVSGV